MDVSRGWTFLVEKKSSICLLYDSNKSATRPILDDINEFPNALRSRKRGADAGIHNVLASAYM